MANRIMPNLQYPVIRAVARFLKQDSYLLDVEAHEQAISHRIAVYLEHYFRKIPGLSVDCEYNKHLNNPKSGTFDADDFDAMRKKLTKCNCSACTHPSAAN